MTNVVLMMRLVAAGEPAGTHQVRELPLPPVAFGLITFAVLAVLLAITWSFRNVAGRH
jgi:hypothetical protein